nr:tryptophan synthase subunit alpha [Conchiformibius kuhniae]
MTRIQTAFARRNGRPALIAYITAGDPDADTTLALMHTLAANGADIIELGVPFSDPMADGTVIQRATERALAQGMTLSGVLELVRRFRRDNTDTPVVLMGYLNPVHAMGYENFAAAAAEAGVDGALTVDCPIEVAEPLQNALQKHGLDSVFLVTPTTGEARMRQIAARASGFAYYVSLKGVTGSAALDTAQVAEKMAVLRKHFTIPIGVGFGIADAEDAKRIGAVADAVIVGSRIVREIEQQRGRENEAVAELVRGLKQALDGAD